jgi:hypothetical protein
MNCFSCFFSACPPTWAQLGALAGLPRLGPLSGWLAWPSPLAHLRGRAGFPRLSPARRMLSLGLAMLN